MLPIVSSAHLTGRLSHSVSSLELFWRTFWALTSSYYHHISDTFKVKVFYGETELRAAAYTVEDEVRRCLTCLPLRIGAKAWSRQVLGGNTFLEGPAKVQK